MTSAGKIGVVLATIALSVAIYSFGDFKGRSKAKEETPAETTTAAFDYQLYKQTQFESLEPAKRQGLEELEKALDDATVDSGKVALLNQLIAESERLKLELPATMYSKQIAVIKNEAEVWDKTGTYFMGLYYNQPETPEVQKFKLVQARECFENAIKLDSANLDYKVRLGVTYMEDQDEPPMQGVQHLLAVVEKDSNHLSANLYLGRFGIVSGQFDKAVARLTKVLSLDPANVEAYILMADAQVGLGNTPKAIEYLEKVKTIVTDPEFTKNVDAYIEKLKNS